MKKVMDYLMIIGGAILFATGLYLIKTLQEPTGLMVALPYIFVGVGCGILGHGLGSVLSKSALRKHPDIEKQIAIETSDERNIALSNKAKAKAYDIMLFTFSALLICFALMGADLTVILLLVAAYLFVVFTNVYYLNKYHKEM